MLLAVDVGNTNIAFGVLKGKKIVGSFRMMSQTAHTSDEYGNNIIAMLRNNGINKEEISGVIVSSVVPNVMHALVNAMIKYLGKQPYIVGPGIKTGIKILTKNPAEIGPDLVVGAVAAYEMYGGPAIVVDFGTATTYVLITENGDFIAGVVSPGIRISAKALWQDTAKLPEIEIKKPDSILAQETISSMQAGLVYGQIGQAKYIINEMKRESKLENVKVVATGGLGRLISEECDEIDIYDPNLLIQGLRIIYEKNKRVKPKLEEFEGGE
ncbi:MULTISPECIES: type III pantothenate kinase [unclassified Butyrivibrio]|uniref:type III pantothenate kinase n=1 Tax=unclassified Butyrivibrio TaxID=2639466 RepID=UPI0003B6EDE1|nr:MULTISPECIES: type III pantothenate kinase [unclassified Butyrivibrio]SDB14277.1 type III pantothenate kinase [Butyrivibrio sp. INlla16]SEK95225.1 type III pantothenate kinase [Butyrivibrio sp. ob235]